jgi:O-antigen/teichoic acid export membrane protein
MQLLFPWYGLVVIWVGIWHEPLVRFWLQENATAVETAFPWIVAGCCLAALSNISGSQLGPLNRVGTGLFFSVLSSGSSLLFVFLGWHFAGITGAAAGFCLARLPLVFQDAAVRRIAGIGYGRQDLQLLVMQGCFGLICGGIFLCTKWMETSQLWSMIWAFVSGAICAAFILSAYLPRQKS